MTFTPTLDEAKSIYSVVRAAAAALGGPQKEALAIIWDDEATKAGVPVDEYRGGVMRLFSDLGREASRAAHARATDQFRVKRAAADSKLAKQAAALLDIHGPRMTTKSLAAMLNVGPQRAAVIREKAERISRRKSRQGAAAPAAAEQLTLTDAPLTAEQVKFESRRPNVAARYRLIADQFDVVPLDDLFALAMGVDLVEVQAARELLQAAGYQFLPAFDCDSLRVIRPPVLTPEQQQIAALQKQLDDLRAKVGGAA